ncbi:hypothetical protein BpHYR1_018510 [Brachionus plicatilis]|uniref:Uncharacterized protein n=1 Tax=Brachionus plicatilis TaxID=10195 RepID=A0A3M7P3D8_BRAPC|nr:hypothetical protein BpHYR1_018510 [Brachionus plicatilis]
MNKQDFVEKNFIRKSSFLSFYECHSTLRPKAAPVSDDRFFLSAKILTLKLTSCKKLTILYSKYSLVYLPIYFLIICLESRALGLHFYVPQISIACHIDIQNVSLSIIKMSVMYPYINRQINIEFNLTLLFLMRNEATNFFLIQKILFYLNFKLATNPKKIPIKQILNFPSLIKVHYKENKYQFQTCLHFIPKYLKKNK